MNVELLVIGKIHSVYIQEGMGEYLKRLRRYINYTVIEIPDVRNARRLSHEEQKEAEGKEILRQVAPSDHLILLDERGRQYTSPEFAQKMQAIMSSGKKRLVVCVGGPYGFSKPVYDRANELLSLSKMTFNHEMVRLFFTEQLYRAMTILKGEPYHH